MRDFLADVRYGWRILLRSPGFAAVAILALALGIGANTAIFSAVDAVLLRPLPYPEADRIVMVWEDGSHWSFPRNTPAPANYFDWKKQNTVFADIAATRFGSAVLTGDGTPELAAGRRVMADFFAVMGVQPEIGRVFTDEEDRTSAKVVVLSNGLWQRRYGGDRGIVGRTILMNGESFAVIGVMPRSFHFPVTEYFAPSGLYPEATRRDSHYLTVVARLKPGVTYERAQSEMQTIARRLETEYPETNTHVGAVIVSLREQIAGDRRVGLVVLLGAAGCVLLIACSNLANLLLAKSTGREREFAVRGALGAGRGRLIRQALTESSILALCGGTLGVALGYAGTMLLERLVPAGLPGGSLGLDSRVLAFSMLTTGITAVLFGLLPALKTARVDLNGALKQSARGSVGGRGRWIRNTLVVSEVALAIVLLVGAGLMIETLRNMRGAEVGFRTGNLLTMRLGLSPAKYGDQQKRMAFYDAVLERVRALPAVRSAAFTGTLPFVSIGNTNGYAIVGRPEPAPGNAQDALYRPVTREYLPTIGAGLKEGRFFTREDHSGSTPVMVINEHFARTEWNGKGALGGKVRLGGPTSNRVYTVVGVVKDIRERGVELPMKSGMYLLMDQNNAQGGASLAVRTETDPLALAKAVTEAVWSVDKDQPVSLVRTMDAIVDAQLENRNLQMTLLSIFAGLAMSLACLGIYGLLSYLVTQRIREIALRMALGASARQVAGMFVGQGLGLTAAGVLVGVGASVMVGRAMRTMLFEVAPTDLRIYVVVTAILGAVALLACYLPARRAAHVDPMMALREE